MVFDAITERLRAAIDFCKDEPEHAMWKCFWILVGGTIGVRLALLVTLLSGRGS